jgi:Costars
MINFMHGLPFPTLFRATTAAFPVARSRTHPLIALPSLATMDNATVNEEIAVLVTELKRLADPRPDGKIVVKFGKLFDDERCANIFEALVGTLRAAKKRKVVAFDGEMLFQGVHDDVEISVV